jgi:DNA-binding PadR family transcriptional regulator
MPRARIRHPDEFLPLTAVAFEILLALVEGERHGYAIMQAVEDQTGGVLKLHPGTLYRALARLNEAGLLEELERPADQGDDERRRYFRLTGLGQKVAAAEAKRLESRVRAAREKRLLPSAGRA